MAVKQYLNHYTGDILFPYTTLDCILSDEESEITGAQAIVSSILSKDDILTYEKSAEHSGDQYIHQSNLSGDNLHILGIYNDGEQNKFIKMHAISDDESAANQYLGADGIAHIIGNGNGDDIAINQSDLSGLLTNTTNPEWFSGRVSFDSSSCSISLDPRLHNGDFYVEGGYLRVRTADHVRQSQVLVDGTTNNPFNIGSGTSPNLLKFINGYPAVNAVTVGGETKFIYLDNGVFKNSTQSVGGINTTEPESTNPTFTPMVLASGVFTTLGTGASIFGGEHQTDDPEHAYTLYIREGKWTINRRTVASSSQLMYLSNGEFVVSNFTVGAAPEPEEPQEGGEGEQEGESEEETIVQEYNPNLTPVSLRNGEFTTCSSCGDEYTPIYLSTNGVFTPITEIKSNFLAKPNPTSGNEEKPHLFVSIFDETEDPHTYKNGWNSINTFVNDILVQGTIPYDQADGVKARTLIARQPADDSTGELEIKWETLPHSVEIEANTNVDKAFYLTGVFSGTPVTPDNVNTPGVLSAWEEYHDIDNKLAKKLEVAINGIYNTPSDDNAAVTVTGIYFKNCKLYQTSDARLKTFVSDLQNDSDLLENISTIKKGKFYWSSDKNQKLDIGVTAQTVEKYFPELVDEDKGVKTVSYSKLSVVALAAIDKLNDKIKLLEKEIEQLKSTK